METQGKTHSSSLDFFRRVFIDSTGIKVDNTSEFVSVAILFGLYHIMTWLLVNVNFNDVLLALTYSAFGSKITVQVTYINYSVRT